MKRATKPHSVRDMLTLTGEATFTGWRAAPGEIQVKSSQVEKVTLTQLNAKRYRATLTASGGPLYGPDRKPISAPLLIAKRQVKERFHQQIEPWKWTRNGQHVSEPKEL